MAKNEKINENFNLSYSSRNDQTGETIMDVNISFENPKDYLVVAQRLNTWLNAIGLNMLKVKSSDSTNDEIRTAYDK